MKKNILITGATGFLGSYILKTLLEDTNDNIYLLIRERNGIKPLNRIEILLDSLNIEKKLNIERLNIIEGDLFKINEEKNLEIINEVFHCAAIIDFNANYNECSKINVHGTKLLFDRFLNSKHLERINHISTAFIAGNKECILKECDLDIGQEFNNAYEKSKFETEIMINNYRNWGLNVSIYRPSIVVGEYNTGRTSSFKMFYQPLYFFYNELFRQVPLDPNSLYNFIPVDIAAKLIVKLSKGRESLPVYHIVSSQHIPLGRIMDISSKLLNFKKPEYVSLKDFNKTEESVVKRKIIEPFIPYLNFKAIFDQTKTLRTIQNINFHLPEINEQFIQRILEFCLRIGFLKKKIASSS